MPRSAFAVVVVLLAVSVLAPAAQAAPQVEGPIAATAHPGDPSHDYPFFASDDNLALDGYVEREFFVAGEASRYAANGTDTATVTSSGHPFRTRMVVRRPARERDFNGTVIVEWFNVSNQYDQEVDWLQTHEHLVRAGYAWVGVSAQRAGVHSATGLRAWNAGRYGTLDLTDGGAITDDTLSYDVFTQAGEALRRSRGADPLGPLRARRVLATGHSQSAGRLRTYYNSVHPLAGVYDGFVLHGIFGNTTVRTDIRTPVWKLQSETDALGFFGPTTRQPDTRWVRTWEVAGTTHGDWKLIVEHGPLRIRDVGAPPEDYPPSSASHCAAPTFSRVPFHMVQAAAYDWLDRWAAGRDRPPSAPLIDLDSRDANGNVLGGIRLPQFDVPTATTTGTNTGPPGTFCFLHGTHSPFDAATLQRLYPSDARYANAVIASTVRNRAAGYMSRFDARWTIADALRSLVPERGEGAVRAVSYRSRVLGATRRMQVYTPPGYATSKRRYPVLYLIHGGGDDDTGWLVKGGAKTILDEAIAREAAEPMIVVMPDARVGTNLGAPVTEDPFPRELVREIVPAVEARFRAERGARSRALAGLSLGGVQVLDTLLQHPGAFAELSAWSTGWFPAQIEDLADRPWLLRDPRINARTQTLELRLGTSDFAYPNMTATRALFDELGVRYEYGETPGGHEWPVWQRYLRELVPRLFDYELRGR